MSVQMALHQAHLAALARRAEGQPEAVRALLQARLQRLQARAPAAKPTAPPDAEAQSPSPLATLLAELAEITGTGHVEGAEGPAGAARPDGTGGPTTSHTPSARSHRELKAVRDYRSTWSRLAVEQRLHQALASVPSNAGPLNTQRLVHQALRTLNMLSPAYLQRLVVQGEALLWLEQLSAPASREIAGAPGPGRFRKG